MRNNACLSILIAATALLFWRCSSDAPTAAGGTDYPNTRTVAGVFTGPDGEALIGAQAVLLSPPRKEDDGYQGVDTAYTDSSGSFVFEYIAPGIYALEGISADRELAIFRDSINKIDDSTAVFDSIPLKTAGSLSGVIDARQSATARVRLRGAPYWSGADSIGRFVISAVPEGVYDLHIAAIDTMYDLPPFDTTITGVTITPDATLDNVVRLPLLYRKPSLTKLWINTTLSGALLEHNLYDFPVVIRLDHESFDFASVASHGADIGFCTPSGVAMPFEIEEWDSAENRATVWLKLDTLHANSSTLLYLFGGDGESSTVARSELVFDTAAGFRAVYHLNEDAPGVGTVGLYRDATAYGAHGNDSVSATGKIGMVGKGQQFDGTNDYIPIPRRVLVDGDVTVSAWIQIDAVTTEFDEGVQIYSTYRHNNLHPYGFELRTHMNDLVFIAGDGHPLDDASSWNIITVMWMHVAAVYDHGSGKVKMFVDGQPVYMNQDQTRETILYDGATSYISAPNNFTMNGIIDEVRVERLQRSEEWLRMCYENQKSRQSLVEF